LHWLHLHHNDFGDAGAAPLAEADLPNLKFLGLALTRISFKAQRMLAERFPDRVGF
jgi:hypothetical protein